MKKQLNEVQKLQKIAGILKESKLDPNEVKDLISKYPAKPLSGEFINDYSPYTYDLTDLKIHHFNGEDKNGIKSIIVGKNKETGKIAYWEVESDDNMKDPYGEVTSTWGPPDYLS